MIYKKYGNTGKIVSAIGFGGMRFKEDDFENDLSKAAEIVRYASSLGINYFDTAPHYCNDKSEEIMGKAFKNMPNPFYVSTKSSVRDEKTADELRQRVEKSLERLGVEKINFLHMWCILDLNQYRQVIAPNGPYEGALKLKEEGLIDHICFSTHATGEEIETMVNDNRFEGVTLGYNATNFAFRQRGIKAAYDRGLGVVTMNPLGGGIIPGNPKFYSFLKEDDADTLAQAALKFNISHEEITVTLTGMKSKEEVEENVKAAINVDKMTPEKMKKLNTHLSSSLDTLCTGCGYCNSCPKGINIPKFMDAYNMYILEEKDESIAYRLKYHWGLKKDLAKECISCSKCELACTQHLPIIERLKYISNI